jgi:hypothetical protein
MSPSMVRQAHHEDNGKTLILSLSKDEPDFPIKPQGYRICTRRHEVEPPRRQGAKAPRPRGSSSLKIVHEALQNMARFARNSFMASKQSSPPELPR